MSLGSNGLNGKTLCPLFDFDFIVRTDVGLIRFVQKNYADPRAFDLEKLSRSDREILSLLYLRDNWNPLSIISNEENMNDIDDLYNSFFSNYKKQIIDLSICNQSIVEFIAMSINSGNNLGIRSSISVRDDIEADEIASHYGGKVETLRRDNVKYILSKDPFYVCDQRFFIETHIEDIIRGKKIYMTPKQYVLNYFRTTDNSLTHNNSLTFMSNRRKDNKGEGSNTNGTDNTGTEQGSSELNNKADE